LENQGDKANIRPPTPDARVTVFGPHPILAITIERRGRDEDDIHLHAGGQGVWVARMIGEMGGWPILCGFCGGETGAQLRPLLDRLSGELRLVDTAAASGCYLIDRRSGEREMIAHSWSDPPSRHENDDLFSVSCAAALESQVLVVCGPVPAEALALEVYGNLVANARANRTTVIVDLSPPRLNSALEGGPDIVKLNDWQLAEFASASVTDPVRMREVAEQVLEHGAKAVVVTRGGDPALVLNDRKAWQLTPPRFEGGASEGSGDSMVGALAATLARGFDWEEALRWAAAAGAANFLRHGLGSGSRDVVADLVDKIELTEL
jgi:1-phosphofructokinase